MVDTAGISTTAVVRTLDRPLPSFLPLVGPATFRPMLGLFGIFGRSRDLQRLDKGLRERGLHPRLMPVAHALLQVREDAPRLVEGLSQEDFETTHFLIFYPTLCLNVTPSHLAFHQILPGGPEWSTIVTWMCFPKSTIARPDFEDAVKAMGHEGRLDVRDIAELIDFCEYYGRQMLKLAGPQDVVPHPGEENELRYIPLGVGIVIPPWNFPGAIMGGMAAGAAYCGRLSARLANPLAGYAVVEAANKAQRAAQFTRALENMKILAEGGTLPPAPPRGDRPSSIGGGQTADQGGLGRAPPGAHAGEAALEIAEQRQRRHQAEATWDDPVGPTDAAIAPVAALDLELELDRHELADLLDRALALLPPLTRTVLIERFIHEAPQAEVARQLGLSEGAIEARVQRDGVDAPADVQISRQAAHIGGVDHHARHLALDSQAEVHGVGGLVVAVERGEVLRAQRAAARCVGI